MILEFVTVVFFILWMTWFFFVTDSDIFVALCEKVGRRVASFSGKVVWITGASTGLGEAMAYELASVGAKLILTARSEDLLQKVKKECIEKSNGKLENKDILVIAFDITNVSCHKESVENAVNHFGKIDVLMNNAARYQIGKVENTELEVDKDIFEVNFFGPVSLTKLVLKQFLLQGKGQFVVVSSVAGKFGIASTASYCATKHALHGYFETLRMEHNCDNIKVTMICPGIFSSSIFQKAMAAKKGEVFQKNYEHYECANMTSERCAHLTLVATANKLFEAWIGYQPFILMNWASQYVPDIYKYIMINIYNKDRVQKLNEGSWPSDLPVWKPLFR